MAKYKKNHKNVKVLKYLFICQNCGFVNESHFCNLDIFKEFQRLTLIRLIFGTLN